ELDGGKVALGDRLARDRETAIVFWNPGCGFCRSMHEELRALEERQANGAPALLVMSTGDVDAIREEGFKSPVLLDPDFSGAEAFEANGTPMAVRVGPDARVATATAVGAADVLALVRGGDDGALRVVRRS